MVLFGVVDLVAVVKLHLNLVGTQARGYAMLNGDVGCVAARRNCSESGFDACLLQQCALPCCNRH
jgi:hypothetical protein